MYKLINQNIDNLASTINRAQVVQPYVNLIGAFNTVNVATDSEFQRTYRHYWALNAARLSDQFCQSYFALLEDLKQSPQPEIEEVAHRLLVIPVHGNGQQALQFSFASKLVHMLDHRLPIYDGLVESFFFLPRAAATDPVNKKLEVLIASYRFLNTEYARVIDQGLLAHAIERFRERFLLGPEYSDVKVIDTLVWRFVSFMKSGAVRNGLVVYD